eukprot:Gb_10597 [translate_table: standard]
MPKGLMTADVSRNAGMAPFSVVVNAPHSLANSSAYLSHYSSSTNNTSITSEISALMNASPAPIVLIVFIAKPCTLPQNFLSNGDLLLHNGAQQYSNKVFTTSTFLLYTNQAWALAFYNNFSWLLALSHGHENATHNNSSQRTNSYLSTWHHSLHILQHKIFLHRLILHVADGHPSLKEADGAPIEGGLGTATLTIDGRPSLEEADGFSN